MKHTQMGSTLRNNRNHWTTWLVVGLALLFVGILALVVGQQPPGPIDLTVTRALQRVTLPGFAALMEWVSVPGNELTAVVLVVVVSSFIGLLTNKYTALFLMAAAFIEYVINSLLKRWVGRPRPSAELVDVRVHVDGLSFPSGHVMFYTVYLGLIVWILWRHYRGLWRWPLILGSVALMALVGLSRITLGAHWFSDVIAAYILGGLFLYASILLYEWVIIDNNEG